MDQYRSSWYFNASGSSVNYIEMQSIIILVLDKKVQQFMMMVGVGACPRPRIIQLLDAAGGDVNRAINYFFQNSR